MRVFYKLDGFKATCLDLEDNGQQEYPNVARLVDGIKLRHANYLAGCDAPDLLVYNPAAANTTTTSDIVGGGDNAASSSSSSSSRLDDLDAVPETDESTPLIVVSPDYLKTHHQQASPPTEVLKEFFDAHYENCSYKNEERGFGCPRCYKILHFPIFPHDAQKLGEGLVDQLREKLDLEARNYNNTDVPLPALTFLSQTPEKSPKSIVEDWTNPMEERSVADRYTLYISSLYADVWLKRSNRDQLEGYFDGFYINLLRQCLDLTGFQCFQREKKLQESTSTCRKVDLLASTTSGTFLVLESAMNGADDKVEQDRGKVAMEIYRVWKRSERAPPIGVLVYHDKQAAVTCVFEVYTMIQHENQQACLVLLDSFKAPVCKADIDDDPLEGKFQTACVGIQRIVAVCLALRDFPTVSDDERQGKRVSTTTAAGGPEAPAKDSYVPIGRPFNHGGKNQSGTPAKRPRNSKKNNCCCAKYELHGKKMFLAKTGWSEVALVVDRATGRRFVRKSERVDWKEHDKSIDWNPYDTEVAVFLKLSLAPTSCLRDTLVKPVDVCVSDRAIYLEELHDVDWAFVRSNPTVALTACIDLLQAVTALHSLNIAHCDIKHDAVMVRRRQEHVSVSSPANGGRPTNNHGGDRDCFVLCDFNLSVVNADELDPEHVPFGTEGWSLQSQRFPVAPAKDHDRFSMGLLLAWSCSSQVNEIVASSDERICWAKSLRRLVEEASRDKNDEIRHVILGNALALCRLDISVEEAARALCDKRDHQKT